MIETRTRERLTPHKLHSVEIADMGGKQVFMMLDKMIEVNPRPDNPELDRHIPKREHQNHICYTKSFCETGADVLESLRRRETLRIEGGTGFGKSTLVEDICAQANIPLIELNAGSETRIADMVGRFVPKEGSMQKQFAEIIETYRRIGEQDAAAGKKVAPEVKLQDETLEILGRADSEKRGLDLEDVIRIATLEQKKFDSRVAGNLLVPAGWEWHNGPLAGAMRYGGIVLINEANFFKFLERFNSVMDYNPNLNIVEHLGEIIRRYTPKEKEYMAATSQPLQGVFPMHDLFGLVLTQNPPGYEGGRITESPALRDRPRTIPVGETTLDDFRDTFYFWMTNKQPTFEHKGDTYFGPDNIDGIAFQSEFASVGEELRQAGINPQKVADFLAQLNFSLKQIGPDEKGTGQIGADWQMEGGDYTYTFRKPIRFFKQFKHGFVVDKQERRRTGKIQQNTNIRDRFQDALDHAYLSTSMGTSRGVIEELIKTSGILDELGQSHNSPEKPQWVDKLKGKGIGVEVDEDGKVTQINL